MDSQLENRPKASRYDIEHYQSIESQSTNIVIHRSSIRPQLLPKDCLVNNATEGFKRFAHQRLSFSYNSQYAVYNLKTQVSQEKTMYYAANTLSTKITGEEDEASKLCQLNILQKKITEDGAETLSWDREAIDMKNNCQNGNESVANALNNVITKYHDGDPKKKLAQANDYPDKPDTLNATSQEASIGQNFAGLRQVLTGLFLFSIEQNSPTPLSGEEYTLLASIMKKKFQISLNTHKIYLISDFCAVYCHKINKRPEECYKFIFKHTFKHLKKLFARNNPKHNGIKNKAFIDDFYSHYFNDAAERLKLPIQNFYLPLSPEAFRNNKGRVISRTINGWYIALLSYSTSFFCDMVAYINGHFLENYKAQIEAKIGNLCNRWERQFADSFENPRVIESITEMVRKSIRCKLPWTVKEVEYAINNVNKLIAKYKTKRLSKMGFNKKLAFLNEPDQSNE